MLWEWREENSKERSFFMAIVAGKWCNDTEYFRSMFFLLLLVLLSSIEHWFTLTRAGWWNWKRHFYTRKHNKIYIPPYTWLYSKCYRLFYDSSFLQPFHSSHVLSVLGHFFLTLLPLSLVASKQKRKCDIDFVVFQLSFLNNRTLVLSFRRKFLFG